MLTITVHQRPLEGTCAANKSCKWVTEAIVSGRLYGNVSDGTCERYRPAACDRWRTGRTDAGLHGWAEGLPCLAIVLQRGDIHHDQLFSCCALLPLVESGVRL